MIDIQHAKPYRSPDKKSSQTIKPPFLPFLTPNNPTASRHWGPQDTMDSNLKFLTSYVPPCFHPAMENLETQAPWLGVALISASAIYLSYLFILSRKEAPESFNVPIPPEVRSNWTGKSWNDVQGEEKKVLEGQVKGVSCYYRHRV